MKDGEIWKHLFNLLLLEGKNGRGFFPEDRGLKVNIPCFMTNSVAGFYMTIPRKKKTKKPHPEIKGISPYKILGLSKSEKHQGNMN